MAETPALARYEVRVHRAESPAYHRAGRYRVQAEAVADALRLFGSRCLDRPAFLRVSVVDLSSPSNVCVAELEYTEVGRG